MIRSHYGLIFVGALVAMLSVAAGAGYFMVFAPLPDPAVATRQELFRWLVLRDMGKESPEIRQRILGRLDTEFDNVGDLRASIEGLDDSRREMLWHNVIVLIEPWLLGQAEQYSQMPAAKKTDYIDHFLNRAEDWNKVASACISQSSSKNSDKGERDGSQPSKLVVDQFQQCIEHAAREQRQKLADFVSAVKFRWLQRQFSSFNFFGERPKTPQAN
jgi:hypothetical protein